MIGPFARTAHIEHQYHDTLSILKTIEQLFHVAPLTIYDAKAPSLEGAIKDE